MSVHDDQLPPPPPVIEGRPISEAPAAVVPWEGTEGNWLRRWWDTLVMAMFRPGAFFTAVRNGGRVDRAILFFAICLAIDSLVSPFIAGQFEDSLLHAAWNRLSSSLPTPGGFDGLNADGELDLNRILPNGLPPGADGHAAGRPDAMQDQIKSISDLAAGLSMVVRVFSCGFSIVLGFVGLFTTAALFQAGALIFIPRRRSFAATLRTVAYAHAPLVCSLLPLVGGLMFFIWLSVLIIIGLRVVHETTRARVVAALSFWPSLLLLTVGLGCALVIRQLLPAVNA